MELFMLKYLSKIENSGKVTPSLSFAPHNAPHIQKAQINVRQFLIRLFGELSVLEPR